MKISRIDAIPVRLPRELAEVTGSAGSPSPLDPSRGPYRWSSTVSALYSVYFETALVKIVLDDGSVGWGEAQAPLAPQVACTIVERLLRPVLVGARFDGTVPAIEALWEQMYATMRVRGQTCGFMIDAMSGVDLALWDLAGKKAGIPVSLLINANARNTITAYVSGLLGKNSAAQLDFAHGMRSSGFQNFKLYYNEDADRFFTLFNLLRQEFGESVGIAADALWRLNPATAVPFGRNLDQRHALWLECPLMPEDAAAHAYLAQSIQTPIAIGESYRTCFELGPFFETRALAIIQPDLGRCGLTGALRIARSAAEHGISIIPHVSIALGPQIAAAIHLSAAFTSAPLLEYSPSVFTIANTFSAEPFCMVQGSYVVPSQPGLCAPIDEQALRRANLFP